MLPTAKAEAPQVKEEPVAVAEPVKVEEPAPVIASGSCSSEVTKYNWDHSVALNVMGAESSGNPNTLNNNASTGDYSVGCFQINLLGSDNLLAKYRDAVIAGYTGNMTVEDLELWLKTPRNNVALAHIIWSNQGWTPWNATTCRYKVACY